MTPAAALRVLGWAAGLGAALGAVYGLLRPLRGKCAALADAVFVLAFGWAWLVLGFGICAGDLRLAPVAAMALACLAFDRTVGRLLLPVFSTLWRPIFFLLGLPCRLLQKTLQKFYKFMKKVFASLKKSGTMLGDRFYAGGAPHGRKQQ
ncbi:MAG: hypothetical protein LUH51_06035 [Firmicutes bacterium]|nr:hypothetical protein [Bacillota bacterium]